MDFSELKSFDCQLDDGLFHIKLNRAEEGNTFNIAFCNEINVVVNEIANRADIRAVLVSSTGKFFSLGGDISLMSGERGDLPYIIKSLTSPLHAAIVRLMTMNAPVVCAVQGKGAYGGALALAASADILVAADDAKFGAAFPGIGFSCDSGTTIGLSYRLGVSRAKRFLLLGETFSSHEALEAGLVDKVVPEADVLSEAKAIARKLANGPTIAFGEMKRLFLNVSSRQAPSQMEDEAQALARVSQTADAWEGLRAFSEKRPARFTGT